MTLLLMLVAVFVPWTSLLKLADLENGAEALTAALAFGGLFGANVVVNGSLWTAYADAFAAGDRDFIRLTLRSSILAIIAIGSAMSLLLMAGGRWIVPFRTERAGDAPWVPRCYSLAGRRSNRRAVPSVST